MNFAIVYLCRGVDTNEKDITDFSSSLKKNLLTLNPVYKYKIYIIFKGWDEKKNINPKYFFKNVKFEIKFFNFSDDGFDLGAYFKVIKYIDEDYVYFFNSTSRIVDNNFFDYSLKLILSEKKLGLLGFAGSFGTPRPSIKKIFFKLKANIYENFIKKFMYFFIEIICFPYHLYLFRNFHNFPNPHIRSHVFLIKKDLYKEFSKISKYPTKKIEVLELESGKNSITQFVKKKGYFVKLVNSKNEVYDVEECDKSQTWRTGSKQYVLAEDKASLIYKKTSINLKIFKEYCAWEKIKTNLKIK